MLKSFADVLNAVKRMPPRRVAVAAAQDDTVLAAVLHAKQAGIADFILIGDEKSIEQSAASVGANSAEFTVIHQPDDTKAAYQAVAMASCGEVDVVMKGLINTADLLRAVLDKEVGLRTGRVLSHVAVFEVPGYDRLIMVTDGGMNLTPSLEQKSDIIRNTVPLAAALGILPAKVAVLAAVEAVNLAMSATLDAASLAKMAERGQIKGVVVDGPLALDNAVSAQAAAHKGIKSPVAGCADVLVVPDIVSGNVLGKSLVYFAGARSAGLVLGAAKPVIVTSRADTQEAKVLSIALGVLLG